MTSPDGVLVLPASKEGTYTISHVRDARHCAAAASDITGSAIIKSYPQAIAGQGRPSPLPAPLAPLCVPRLLAPHPFPFLLPIDSLANVP